MDNKYKKLVDTLPKESEDLWFEYNLAVNKIMQENQQLHNKIDKAIEYIEKCSLGEDYYGNPVMLAKEDEGKDLLEILKGENND